MLFIGFLIIILFTVNIFHFIIKTKAMNICIDFLIIKLFAVNIFHFITKTKAMNIWGIPMIKGYFKITFI